MRDQRLLLVQHVANEPVHECVQLGDAHGGQLDGCSFRRAGSACAVFFNRLPSHSGQVDHVREAGRPLLCGLRAFLGLLQNEGDDPFELHVAIAQARSSWSTFSGSSRPFSKATSTASSISSIGVFRSWPKDASTASTCLKTHVFL